MQEVGSSSDWQEVSESCSESECLLGDSLTGPKLLGGAPNQHGYQPVSTVANNMAYSNPHGNYGNGGAYDNTAAGNFGPDHFNNIMNSKHMGMGSHNMKPEEQKYYTDTGKNKFKRIPFGLVLKVIVAMSVWIVAQTVIFWLVGWKQSIYVARVTVVLLSILTLIGPAVCCSMRRVMSFPYPPGGGLQFGAFVISGIFLGTIIAMQTGYYFARYSELGSVVISRNVSPITGTSQKMINLDKTDYIQFSDASYVSRIRAKRFYSADLETYFCAAPVFGPSQKLQQANFFAISSNECCREDEFNCPGWSHKGFYGRIVHRAAFKGASPAPPAALAAAEEAATKANMVNNPRAILVEALEGAEAPSTDASTWLVLGFAVGISGVLLWPAPALCLWGLKCKHS